MAQRKKRGKAAVEIWLTRLELVDKFREEVEEGAAFGKCTRCGMAAMSKAELANALGLPSDQYTCR